MKYLWIAVAALAAVVAIVRRPPQPAAALAVSTAAPHAHVTRFAGRMQAEAVVYVAGAVVRPGLYRLPPGARANDAVRLAGGFSGRADQAGVNLAQHVEDGDEIRVPVAGERPARAAATRSRRTGTARTRKPPPGPIELNTASPQQLGTLPGLGPALAERIVAFREANGDFASVDELLDVAGMTQRRLDAIAPYLIVNGAP
jgi:competence protein ComEA